MKKRRFQKFSNIESQDLETQSYLHKSISRASLQTIPFHIYDYVGKKILQGTFNIEIQVPSTVSKGTYYLRVADHDGQVFTGKFVKE